MPDAEIDARHDLAVALAAAAGARGLGHFAGRDALVVEAKASPQDIVSRADRELEQLIRAGVAERFPDDGFLGEEYGATPGASGYVWVIDPIDGTSPFLHGLPHWCVSIAVQRGEATVAGAIAVPASAELYSARVGRGARLNGAPLALRPELTLRSGQTAIGASHRTPPDAIAAVVRGVMAAGGMFYRNGSGALMLAYVAAGRLAACYEPHMNAWDCLAGLLLVREAGGRTAAYPAGGDLGAGGEIIAAGPGAWDELLAVLGRAESR